MWHGREARFRPAEESVADGRARSAPLSKLRRASARSILGWRAPPGPLLGVLIAGLATMPLAAGAEPSGGGPLVLRCGKPELRKVALTFDDGPTARFTPSVLQILSRERVRAAFFVLGGLARYQPRLLERIHREGHLVASHSFSHPKRGDLESWRGELRRTVEAVRAAGLELSPYFRPPHGKLTPAVRQAAGELGYTIILYTLLSSDWTRPGKEALVRQVVGGLGPGGIVVLHDGGGDRGQTVAALPEIIRGLRGKGLEPVRLDELLGPRPKLEQCARAR